MGTIQKAPNPVGGARRRKADLHISGPISWVEEVRTLSNDTGEDISALLRRAWFEAKTVRTSMFRDRN